MGEHLRRDLRRAPQPLGGEEGGISLVWNFVPFFDAYPFTSGASIILEDNWQMFCGQSSAATANKGAIHIRTPLGIPQHVVVRNNIGHTGTPTIHNSASVNIAQFLTNISAGASILDEIFRYDIYPNYTSSDTTGIPDELYRFTGRMWGKDTLTWTDLNAGASDTQTLTVQGAQPGDPVSIGMHNDFAAFDISVYAWVSAANTVSIRIRNNSGSTITLSSMARTTTAVVRRRGWDRD